MPRLRIVTALLFVTACLAPDLSSQQRPSGLEVGALPAVNFDSDEGFGYGAIAALYQYGDGTELPYRWSALPTVFLTTEGRRDITLFFDAPHLLAEGWRLDGFLGIEKQIATPYYGVGNATLYDEGLEAEDGANPFYYRFGRTRRSARVNLQHGIGELPLRWLFGAGFVTTDVVQVPEDDGTTLFAEHFPAEPETEWTNYVRGGLVWDTRDRETGPTRGTWTELLVQRVDEKLGADFGYTRWTVADRRYFTLVEGVTFAHRVVLQEISEGVPVHDLFDVHSSFKSQEGLGGSGTVRGILRNRFAGRGIFVWNAELRWRVAEFEAVGRPFHLAVSAFVDQGRVWAEDVEYGELLTDLHRGYGGGLRVGMSEDFVVAVDIGRSAEAGMPIYIGLGYLY